MIIFLYGQNSYSLIQYINELLARYQKKYPGSFNIHRFDLEEGDGTEIRNAIKGTSFFKQVKFIIAKNPFAKAPLFEKTIKENGINKEKDTVLLLYQSEASEELKKKNQKFFEFLKKESQAKEFKPATVQAAAKFASNYLAKNKINIKKELLAKLVKETDADLWRLKNELDKLAGFLKEVREKEITEEELAKLIHFRIDQNIFAVIDAAFSNQAKALILFEDYFSKGGDPLYLVSMIAFQLKNMIAARELMEKNGQYGQILKKTGMHPYFFKKIYDASKKYSLEELKKTFQKLIDFEMALKTGQAEAENVFFKVFL